MFKNFFTKIFIHIPNLQLMLFLLEYKKDGHVQGSAFVSSHPIFFRVGLKDRDRAPNFRDRDDKKFRALKNRAHPNSG